jgi:hypothetical protein
MLANAWILRPSFLAKTFTTWGSKLPQVPPLPLTIHGIFTTDVRGLAHGFAQASKIPKKPLDHAQVNP